MAQLYDVPYTVSNEDIDLKIENTDKRQEDRSHEPGIIKKPESGYKKPESGYKKPESGYMTPESGYMKISTVIVLFVAMCVATAVLVVGTGLIVFFLASDNASSDQASTSDCGQTADAIADVTTRSSLTSPTQQSETTTIPSNNATTSHVDNRCPDRWIRFDESCYLFSNVGQVFIKAKDFCESRDSYLVHVNNEMENSFLRSVARDLKAANHWIGVSDEQVEGIWKWTDTDQTGDFLGWRPGEPTHGREENCASFYATADYLWVDITCEAALRPICEKH